MKKFFIAATMMVAIATSAFAGATAENLKAIKTFKTEFKDAKNVSWKVGEGYVKASFEWNGIQMESFYNEDGEAIATSRPIDINVLPVAAIKTLNNKYADYQTTEAVEFDSVQDGVSYYVSKVKDNTKVILRISSTGDVSVFKKI